MDRYKKILSEIIKGKNQWSDLKIELSKHNIDNRALGQKDTTAGIVFEVFTKYYFLTAPEFDGEYSDVWLYDEIPLNIKEKFGLGRVEHGMDLLLKSHSGEYTSVQCKFSNDESTKLGWSKHKTSHLFSYFIDADRFILFSNCATVDDVTSSRSENFTFFNIADLL
tara:strand:+ start:54 stop:551 length:498 start_codon:yes stop_codon:yes gene_type:complete